MSIVGLISCVGKKRSEEAKAEGLYTSPLFTKSRKYVEQRCDKWFILSAKHGLLETDDIIAPYEETLNTKSRDERQIWAHDVWERLQRRLRPSDHVVILAGQRYREYLVPLIAAYGCQVNVPMEGLGIGRQLQWLTRRIGPPSRERDIDRLYEALRRLEHGLGGKRLLGKCTGRQGWPRSGVYSFFEPGEVRRGSVEPRIVRVGTHGVSRGSGASLWGRLRAHRGTENGLGSHRASIFRLHVGAALAAKYPESAISTWGVGQSAKADIRAQEKDLERRVSAHIGKMSVLWLSVQDDPGPSSDRAYLERNLIGLLVGKAGPADPPSNEWLGCFSPDERIRHSGLWNLAFLDYVYSPDFLDVLDEYVLITLDKKPQPSGPIAPLDWYTKERLGLSRNQLSLFRGESDVETD